MLPQLNISKIAVQKQFRLKNIFLKGTDPNYLTFPFAPPGWIKHSEPFLRFSVGLLPINYVTFKINYAPSIDFILINFG